MQRKWRRKRRSTNGNARQVGDCEGRKKREEGEKGMGLSLLDGGKEEGRVEEEGT